MAVAYDAQSKSETSAAGSSLSWSHTCTGSNLILVVGVARRGGTSSVVSGITFNSVALTNVTANHPSNAIGVELWRLLAPDTGAHTIEITMSSSASIIEGFGVSYTGVHQSSPTGTPADIDGNSSAPSVDVTSAAGELVVDVVGIKATDATETLTAGASQTSRGEEGSSDGGTIYMYGGMSEEAGAGTVTMSWDASPASDVWVISGVALKPTGGDYTKSGYAIVGTAGYGDSTHVVPGSASQRDLLLLGVA